MEKLTLKLRLFQTKQPIGENLQHSIFPGMMVRKICQELYSIFCLDTLTQLAKVQSQDSFARKKHEEVMHERMAGKYECDQCDRGFTTKNALQYHRDSHEELKVICELCGFKSSSESNLTKHILVHSKGSTSETQQHQCEVCDLNFSK